MSGTKQAAQADAPRSKTAFLIVFFAVLIGLGHHFGFVDLDPNQIGMTSTSSSQGPHLDVSALEKQASAGDSAAAQELALYHALTFLSDSAPENRDYLEPTEQSQAAERWFEAAAALPANADNCDPFVWHGMLKMTLGDMEGAKALLEKGNEKSDPHCQAMYNVNVGLMAEIKGDDRTARELYIEARQQSDKVHENFFDRDYDATDPANLNPAHFASRLLKLSAFREYYEAYYQFRDNNQALEFSHAPREEGGTFIRGGTINLEDARKHLADHGYVVLRGFLSPWETRTIQKFYGYLIEIRAIDNFDDNLARTITYNDRMSHWLGHIYTRALSELGGRPLKHVYSFLCWHSIRDGNENRPRLIPHTDREDNEYTVSIQMHYNDVSGETAWPLWVHGKRQEFGKAGWKDRPPTEESVELRLEDGDALLFRGRHYIHWREDMPDTGNEFSSLLLHYVHKEWDWKEFKFVRQVADPTI